MKEKKLIYKVIYDSSYAIHYCGNCGVQMEFVRTQDSDHPMVYRCPQCGELEAHKQ